MEIIQNQYHTKETLYFALTRMFERASYYGFKTLIVLYMVGETLKMERSEALNIYGVFTASLVFSQILGAVLGDLVIGNRRSVILGAILQAIGTFCICIPLTTGLYLGLFLIALGCGFYTPNLISNFGKLYFNKTKLLDSGFTIFHLATNLGSFFGVLLIGYLGDKYGFNFGFILAGVLMLISLIPIVLSKERNFEKTENNRSGLNKRILIIVMAFTLVGLFWGFNDMSYIRNSDLQLQFKELSSSVFPDYFWQVGNSIFFLPISIIAIVLWNKFYSNHFFKIMLGFIFGAIAIGILLLIPEIPTEQHLMIFFISLLFFGIAEVHIAPVIYSILTKYSNPKYLAILIGLTYLPTALISFSFGLFNDKIYDNPILGLKIGIIGMAIIGIGLISFIWWNKKLPTTSA
ncbi:peptide MFS transporter [Sphingobacterium alkalisoli]|uniref:Peptide MFS transporter n=1 Tax=Sphingobacterium alkalisoli TaxID=1874115 RepID=A0A4U0GVI7_9SPHI|nr:MFS transporter [Sphingobacterium alkalisoli]TJY62584.1 peptide MFS transporter [Sphingobacterium alkalisoli]GGH27606.1 MFS transporter [Sphingobacterium alkalisoli]